MTDIAAQFREFSRLDMARLSKGLSVLEHERWAKLKASLDRSLAHAPGPGGRNNRRSAKRVATRLNCAFKSGADHREAVVSNLSTGGMFIRTDWPLPVGSKIRISLALEDLGKEIAVEGMVVSNNVDVDCDEVVHGMGVRFSRVPEDVAEHLNAVYVDEVKKAVEGGTEQKRVA
ncbi:MAG: PilZ domain-containing protein [Myxococcota bacterium]